MLSLRLDKLLALSGRNVITMSQRWYSGHVVVSTYALPELN